MKPTIARETHQGRPSERRPDRRRRPSPPWSLDWLALDGRIRHHALSPDGTEVAFLWDRDGNSDLWLLPLRTGAWPRRLTFHRPAHTYWSDRAPAWDRQGRRLLLVIEREVWLVEAATGVGRRLTGYGMAASGPLFAADGRGVFFGVEQDDKTNLASLPSEPRPGEWPTAVTYLAGDVGETELSADGAWLAFTFSPRGDLNRSEICLVPSAGGEVRHLTGAPGVRDRRPRWSPDGRRLAFLSNRSGWVEIHGVAVEGGEAAPLTQTSADVLDIAWSPDGGRLAYVVNRSGEGRLEVRDLASGRVRVVGQGGGWYARPQWGPDGRWLTVEFETPTTPPDLYRLTVEGDPPPEAERITDSRSPVYDSADLVTPVRIDYPSSDGTMIPGFLYRPTRATAVNRRPAIVYPHGGPTDNWALIWSLRLQWLVAKGYGVLAPDYRGSTGHGLEFERSLHGSWGRVDVEDVLAAGDYLAGVEWVDPDRLGIFGSSYGSYLAVLALARDPRRRFRCGVAEYGDSDILRSWATGDRIGREDLERQMGHPAKDPAGYRQGSPIFDVAEISAPLLITHGLEDRRVHPRQSEELVDELKRLGKTFEYVVYAEEGHGLLHPANRKHFYGRVERFLDWYLM